jgi:hypothetical protein
MRFTGPVRFGLRRRRARGYERPMNRRAFRILIAVVLALVVAGPSSDALAKTAKVQMRATINGKTVKLKKNGSITGGGLTVAFFAIAQTKPRPLLRTLGIGCGQYPPPTVPGPMSYCTTTYQETKISRHPVLRAWTDVVGDTQVTIDSYDGTSISGHFVTDVNSIYGDPPVHIEGEFSGPIQATQ